MISLHYNDLVQLDGRVHLMASVRIGESDGTSSETPWIRADEELIVQLYSLAGYGRRGTDDGIACRGST